jgi:hypothetical protein
MVFQLADLRLKGLTRTSQLLLMDGLALLNSGKAFAVRGDPDMTAEEGGSDWDL